MPQTAKARRASLRNLAKARKARKQHGGALLQPFIVPPQYVTKPMYRTQPRAFKTHQKPVLAGAGRYRQYGIHPQFGIQPNVGY